MTRQLLLCSCDGTQNLDRDGIEAATGVSCSPVHFELCGRQAGKLAEALAEPDAEIVVACAQEVETFAALTEEIGVEPPVTLDLRDRAGWSDEGGEATPKIAALIAAAAQRKTPWKTMEVTSAGTCLVIGAPETALAAAGQLADHLSVTCLVSGEAEAIPGPVRRFDVAAGRVRNARGALGGFEVSLDAVRETKPSGRGMPGLGEARNGGASECDIIVDLSGNPPLFPAHEKRDGYLRADPGDPIAVQRVLLEASHLVGTFEKIRHVALEESLCAHSRAQQTGCTRCLDICPTGAISSAGDHVAIDPHVCAGCGACSAVCPSGAVSYDAPPVGDIFATIRTLSVAFREAGGSRPRLLVHYDGHGREMIALAARFGRGLPARVIPLELPALATFGHAEMMVALATGFETVEILLSPKSDRETLSAQAELANTMADGLGAGGMRVSLVDAANPDAMSDALYGAETEPLEVKPILPLGRRRDSTRLAARALAGGRDIAPIALPAGAPYGSLVHDAEACTLCLSCTGLCPSGALGDNPDKPELSFTEEACLQCGLCATVCPENAITLEPRLDISNAAIERRILKAEEPYTCIECGKPFGVKSTIERIVVMLEGQHSMFTNSDNARLIRMCDDCRVKAQYHDEAAPMRMGTRPRPRTAADYRDDKAN